MAHRFDGHGRSTGEQQKATVKLQNLATEGCSHRFTEKHGTAPACTTRTRGKVLFCNASCEHLPEEEREQAPFSLRPFLKKRFPEESRRPGRVGSVQRCSRRGSLGGGTVIQCNIAREAAILRIRRQNTARMQPKINKSRSTV